MNERLKQFIRVLYTRKIIGNKHIPEHLMIKGILRGINNQERKTFICEYELLIKNEMIFRLKKRTGKGTGWHISLNPDKLKEIMGIIGEKNETSTGWSVLPHVWENYEQ